MYSFFSTKGAGYITMGYERVDAKGRIEVPHHLGHTVVTLAESTYPSGLIAPSAYDVARFGRTDGSELDERAAAVAEADRYTNLEEFVVRGSNAWRELLDGTTIHDTDTHFAPMYKEPEESRTSSGLVIISDIETGLTPPEGEFAGWVATPPEMDSIERIAGATREFYPRPDDDLPMGNYM